MLLDHRSAHVYMLVHVRVRLSHYTYERFTIGSQVRVNFQSIYSSMAVEHDEECRPSIYKRE